MSWRVHSNVALAPDRQLPLAFNTGASAVGTTAPNSLRTGLPSIADAMGLARHAGLVSLFMDNAAQVSVTAYYWSYLRNKVSPSHGWILAGPVAAVYTQSVDPEATATFTIPEGSAVFIQSSANVTNCWMAGTVKHSAQALPDLTPTITS